MKKKVLAKSTRELGRKIGDMDGKYKGMSQAEGEKAMRWFVNIIAAEMILDRKSTLALIKNKAEAKVRRYYRKTEAKIMAKGKK